MKAVLHAAPALEPITLTELKEHLKIDSGSLSDNLSETQHIAPAAHQIYELMTLDVAPGGAGWSAGDTITGVLSGVTSTIVTKLTALTYYVRGRSGDYTLGEVLTNGTDTADQGAAHPVLATGYYLIGTGVDVLGYDAVVILNSGTNGAGGTVDAKIQESDDNATFTDWTGGAFTQVTEANDNAIQEIQYTGTKRYIRVVVKVLVAASVFGITVLRHAPTSDEDDYLTSLIKASRHEAEAFMRRGIYTQTWDYYLQAWPSKNYIELPFGNLQSVASIVWKDSAGTETTLTVTTDYLVETNGEQLGRIVLPYGGSWPGGTLYPSNPITIRFVCGWASQAAIPEDIKNGIKMLCSKRYLSRGENIIGTIMTEEKAALNLMRSYRLWGNFQ